MIVPICKIGCKGELNVKKTHGPLLSLVLSIVILTTLFYRGGGVAYAEEMPLDQAMAITNQIQEFDLGASSDEIGQSFVAGRNGAFQSVAFYLKKKDTGASDMLLKLYQADAAGLPTANPLRQVSMSTDLVSDDWDWVVVTFDTPISVIQGQRYAAVLQGGSGVAVGMVKGTIYKEGVCLVGNSAKQDATLPFMTYVAPPSGMDQAAGGNYTGDFIPVDIYDKAAQTFTPSQSGYLTQISLFMADYRESETEDLNVTIQTVNPDGAPSGVILAQSMLKGPIMESNWREVAFPTAPLVEAGKAYAIVLTSNNDQINSYAIAHARSDVYGGGRIFIDYGSGWDIGRGKDWDILFRTYIVPVVDSQLPSAILSMTADYSEQATLNMEAMDSGTASSGIKQVSYRVNGGDIQSQTGEKATINITEDGTFLVEYWPEDNSGKIGQSYFTNVHVDNKEPVATLLSFEDGMTVKGKVPLKGTVSDSHLLNWVLSVSESGKEQWASIASGTNAVTEDLLAEWNTDRVSEMGYDVRLVATDRSGKSTASNIQVHVKREATATPGIDSVDLAWPTVEGAVTYDVARGDNVIVYTGSATSYKHERLSPNTTYTYNIYANFPDHISILLTTLTVKTLLGVPVTGVTLDRDELTLKSGGASGTLTATVEPADATNKAVSWTSDDESVAKVENGIVTPVRPGAATIVAMTEDGYFTDWAEVTVQAADVPVTGVTLDKSTLALKAGGATGTLQVTIQPDNATNKNVSWSSSNTEVATVDNGVVTPLKKGTTTIMVRTRDGGFEASTVVTVSTPPVTPPVTPPPALSLEEQIRVANLEAARVIANTTDESTVEQQVSASVKRLSDLIAASKLKQQTELELITDTADTVFAAMMGKWSQGIGDEDLVLEQTHSLLAKAFLPVLDDIAVPEQTEMDKATATLAQVIDTVIAKLGKQDISDKWANKLGETFTALFDKVGISESDDRRMEEMVDRIEHFASVIEKIETSLDNKASLFELEKTFRMKLNGDLESRTEKMEKRVDKEEKPFATLSRKIVKALAKNRINLYVASEDDRGVWLSNDLFGKHDSDAFTIYFFERDNLKTPTNLAQASDKYQFGLEAGGEEITQMEKGSVRITLPYETKSKYLLAYRYDEAKKSWKLLTTSSGKKVDVKKKGKQSSFDIEQVGTFLVADAGVQSISVTPKRASLLPGEKLQLTVTGKLSDRSKQDLTSVESGTVYDSNSSSITVDENGLIQIAEDAKTGERASITVKNGNKSAKVSTTVATVKRITATAKKKSVRPGATLQLNVTANLNDHSNRDVTKARSGTTYSIKEADYAEITEDGLLKISEDTPAGTKLIVLAEYNGFTGECTISVNK